MASKPLPFSFLTRPQKEITSIWRQQFNIHWAETSSMPRTRPKASSVQCRPQEAVAFIPKLMECG